MSNSDCGYRSPVVIDLFCSLISESSVTEIQLSKLQVPFCANDIITAFPFTERDAICQNHIKRENVPVVCSTVSP